MKINMAKIKNHKSEKKNSFLKIILILLIIIFLTAAITQVLYYYFKYQYHVEQIKVYDMKLSVGDYVGFDVGNESVNFGTVIPGGEASRNIIISSNKTVKVEIILEGEIAPFIKISENNFIFTGSKSLAFDVVVSEDMEMGNYTGKIIMLFRGVR